MAKSKASQNESVNTGAEPHSIGEYADSCRSRIPSFLDQHYRLESILNVQKLNWRSDIWRLPLNSLWALPFISLKKTAESIDKMGWSLPLHWMERCPSGFKTSLHEYFEKKIALDLFQVNSDDVKMRTVKKELKKYALGRAVVANLSASLTTFLLGWLFLGQGTLGIFNLIDHLGEYFARDRSADRFIFGKSIGQAFYGLVKPEISYGDMFLALLLTLSFLTIVSFATSLIYAPLRKKLGLEELKLLKMINEIEDRLILDSHKLK